MPSKNKLLAWIGAMRLRTLPLSLSTILTGSSFAIFEQSFKTEVFFLAILTTFFLQVLSNFANDFGDAEKGTDNQERLGPIRAVQSGDISLGEMKKAVVAMSILSLLSGLALLWVSFHDDAWMLLLFLGIGLFAIWAAIRYTAGKNPYGYRAWGDVFVWLFFGMVGVVGTYFLHTKSVSLPVFVMANAIGFWSASVLNLNNIRDLENDKACGKITLAVKLGLEKAYLYQLLLTFLAFFLASMVMVDTKGIRVSLPLIFASLLPFVFSFKALKIKPTPQSQNQALKQVALSTFAISLLVFVTFQWG